jgi:hypothetical protein
MKDTRNSPDTLTMNKGSKGIFKKTPGGRSIKNKKLNCCGSNQRIDQFKAERRIIATGLNKVFQNCEGFT